MAARAAAKTKPASASGTRPTLRIAEWNHLLGGYDTWFTGEYATRWGEEHGCDVVVDLLPYAQLLARAEIEVRERRGHDLFGFPIGLPVRFEDATIDHVDIIEEARRKVGPLLPAVERMVRSTRTGRYFGVPDFWTPCPTIYRRTICGPRRHADHLGRRAPGRAGPQSGRTPDRDRTGRRG